MNMNIPNMNSVLNITTGTTTTPILEFENGVILSSMKY